MAVIALCLPVSGQSGIHPSRRFGRAKDVARRSGAAGLIYVLMKLNARAALTGGLRTGRFQTKRSEGRPSCCEPRIYDARCFSSCLILGPCHCNSKRRLPRCPISRTEIEGRLQHRRDLGSCLGHDQSDKIYPRTIWGCPSMGRCRNNRSSGAWVL